MPNNCDHFQATSSQVRKLKNFSATKMIFKYGNRQIEASLNDIQCLSDLKSSIKSMFSIPGPPMDI